MSSKKKKKKSKKKRYKYQTYGRLAEDLIKKKEKEGKEYSSAKELAQDIQKLGEEPATYKKADRIRSNLNRYAEKNEEFADKLKKVKASSSSPYATYKEYGKKAVELLRKNKGYSSRMDIARDVLEKMKEEGKIKDKTPSNIATRISKFMKEEKIDKEIREKWGEITDKDWEKVRRKADSNTRDKYLFRKRKEAIDWFWENGERKKAMKLKYGDNTEKKAKLIREYEELSS